MAAQRRLTIQQVGRWRKRGALADRHSVPATPHLAGLAGTRRFPPHLVSLLASPDRGPRTPWGLRSHGTTGRDSPGTPVTESLKLAAPLASRRLLVAPILRTSGLRRRTIAPAAELPRSIEHLEVL